MSVEDNKASVRRAIEEIWNKYNLDLIPEYYDSNFVWHTLQGDIQGLEGVKQFATMVFGGFPDFHIDIEDMVGEGDKVVVRGLFSGTHQGDFMGIPATGKKTAYPTISITRIVGGKSVENWIVNDRLGMFQQIGVTPPMG